MTDPTMLEGAPGLERGFAEPELGFAEPEATQVELDPPASSAEAVLLGPRPPDHLAIDRLASSLLPALIAKLSATGLGEIEIRQDGWKLRARRPAEGSRRGSGALGRRGGPSRSQPGHAGHGHLPAAVERHDRSSADPGASNTGDGREDGDGLGQSPSIRTVIVSSPAVGVYQPKKGVSAGSRVRTGDRVGAVDMLGVPQEVVSPVDGIVGDSYVEAGEAVEYGQEIVAIQPAEGSV